MSQSNQSEPSRRAGIRWRRWVALIALSAMLAVFLALMGLPAAALLGAMGASILMATRDRGVHLPRPFFLAAQAVVGIMIAGNLPPGIFNEIARDWPIFLLGIGSTLFAAFSLGIILTRSGTLPGTTAIWGSGPGAASVMTLMSADFGADMRLVAFMQYLRVACCAIAAALVARIFGAHGGESGGSFSLTIGASDWSGVALSLAVAAVGAFAGIGLRVPGGALVVPMVLGMGLKLLGFVALDLPSPILVVALVLLGWGIGLRFTPEVTAHAARAFPRVLGAILLLLVLCAGFGGLLVLFADIDPLTAYLATSPGGADSVAIIATGTNVDVPFVIAMQVGRFLCVIVLGPTLARWASRWGGPVTD